MGYEKLRSRLPLLLGLPLVAMSAVAGGGSLEKRGPMVGPIVVAEESGGHPTVSPERAALVAARSLGVSDVGASAAVLVRAVDQVPLGPPSVTVGWSFSRDVLVSNDDRSVGLRVSVIVDGSSGCVVSVRTEAGDDWLLPVMPFQDPEQMAAMDGWRLGSELPVEMESTVVEAIDATWRFGFDPAAAGQVIVRPRWIESRFPARLENGELVPLRARERVWLVQVCGVKTADVAHPAGGVYATGILLQFRDGSLEFVRGLPIP